MSHCEAIRPSLCSTIQFIWQAYGVAANFVKMDVKLDLCITSYFEKGLQNEIQLWLSLNEMEASVQGCRFHFIQSIRKRMKQFYGRAIDRDLTKKVDSINGMVAVSTARNC